MSATTPQRRALVLVAHPDDETFGCGSLLLHLAERGVRTTVTCLTRGEAGEVRNGVDAPDGLGALREAEVRAAAAALHVTEIEVLDFLDSGMTGDPEPGAVCGTPLADLLDAVRAAVERHRPDVVITLDGGDGHRDHLRLRSAVEQTLVGGPIPVYLQALPRSLMHDWVRFHDGDLAAAEYTALPEIGTPDAELTTMVDTAAHLAARESAIALHRSQQSPFEGLPDALRHAFLGREHLVRTNPPWTGGPPETGLELRTLDDRPVEPASHHHSRRCWWHPTRARWMCVTASQ